MLLTLPSLILHISNSYSIIYCDSSHPARAVNLLGLETVKNLVLGVGAFSEINASSNIFSVKKLWSHSVAVGTLAKKIALNESDDKELIDNSFIAGLLHDIGKLVLLAKLLEKYEQAVLLAGQYEMQLRMAEKEIFDTVHCDIGAYLMGLWGMPGPVVEAIGFHHRIANYPGSGFSPAIAVHVANVLYYENRPDEIIGAPHLLGTVHLQKLGFGDKINQWRELCTECFEQDDDND